MTLMLMMMLLEKKGNFWWGEASFWVNAEKSVAGGLELSIYIGFGGRGSGFWAGRFFRSAHFNLSRNSAIFSILNNFSNKAIMKIILVPRLLF